MINDSPHNLIPEDIQLLTGLLMDCDLSKEVWDRISSDLMGQLGVGFDELADSKLRIYGLVTKLLKFPGGIETLLSRVRYWTDRNTAWVALAKVAFRLLCRWPVDFNNQADRLIGLIEEINPAREVIERIRLEQPIDLPKKRRFTNAFDVILVLFERPEKTQALEFIQALAGPEVSYQQSGDLTKWLEQASLIFEDQLPPALVDADALTIPASQRERPRLNLQEFGEQIFRQEVREIKVANPYLLGDKFVGREKELGDLCKWLQADESGMLCICDLGGLAKARWSGTG